jgi:Na+/proline symporter
MPFEERERAFGLAATSLLPAGFVGLMTASLLATVMSTCSAFMVDGAALFTENLYRPFVKTQYSDQHFLRVARISSIAITACGFLLGRLMTSVISATVQFISILPFVGITFWIGIIWPRATRAAAWSSTIGAAAVFYASKLAGISNAWSSLTSMLTGIALILLVSPFTRREPEENIARVFGYLEVPVGCEERLLKLEVK